MNQIGKIFCCVAFTLLTLASLDCFGAPANSLRAPAVPLVACDPYFSIWSPADHLTDANTMHWTRRPHRLTGLVRIDGKSFRVLGIEPEKVPALPQTGPMLSRNRLSRP